jgi:hypothetical protein
MYGQNSGSNKVVYIEVERGDNDDKEDMDGFTNGDDGSGVQVYDIGGHLSLLRPAQGGGGGGEGNEGLFRFIFYG